MGVGEYTELRVQPGERREGRRRFVWRAEKLCVGPENRFGKAQGQLLVDKQATSKAILAAIDAIQAAAKPGDWS